ncbi:hypothetical protein [Cryobacterium sp. M96]|uniref:hypothetical protein n=1 Tax=Cryobacterium sp. M96 TaxID=2048295 RepID=UPI0013048954|nr:hypothetical protein [Cryobacterium sp. M96]
MVRGRTFVDRMREVEAGYRKVSRELTLSDWNNESHSKTVLDGLARLTSALQ